MIYTLAPLFAVPIILSLFLISGAHTLSGAVLDPRALKELFPDWKERGVSVAWQRLMLEPMVQALLL